MAQLPRISVHAVTLIADWMGIILAPLYQGYVESLPIGKASSSIEVERVGSSSAKRLPAFERESEMPDFDVEAFVTKLDRMGMKLTAVPLADGKLRVNRWRMLSASEHARQIEDLWTMQIGNDRERIDVLAAHLAKAAPREAANCISSTQLRIQSISASEAVTRPYAAPGPRSTAGSQFEPPPQKRPGAQWRRMYRRLRRRIQVMAPHGAAENAAGPQNASGPHRAVDLQKVAGTPLLGNLQNKQ